jgi:hypothetical protein
VTLHHENGIRAAVCKADPNARLRKVMVAFVSHLHTFAREVRPNRDEYDLAIDFLNRIGNGGSIVRSPTPGAVRQLPYHSGGPPVLDEGIGLPFPPRVRPILLSNVLGFCVLLTFGRFLRRPVSSDAGAKET